MYAGMLKSPGDWGARPPALTCLGAARTGPQQHGACPLPRARWALEVRTSEERGKPWVGKQGEGWIQAGLEL